MTAIDIQICWGEHRKSRHGPSPHGQHAAGGSPQSGGADTESPSSETSSTDHGPIRKAPGSLHVSVPRPTGRMGSTAGGPSSPRSTQQLRKPTLGLEIDKEIHLSVTSFCLFLVFFTVAFHLDFSMQKQRMKISLELQTAFAQHTILASDEDAVTR